MSGLPLFAKLPAQAVHAEQEPELLTLFCVHLLRLSRCRSDGFGTSLPTPSFTSSMSLAAAVWQPKPRASLLPCPTSLRPSFSARSDTPPPPEGPQNRQEPRKHPARPTGPPHATGQHHTPVPPHATGLHQTTVPPAAPTKSWGPGASGADLPTRASINGLVAQFAKVWAWVDGSLCASLGGRGSGPTGCVTRTP